MSVTHFIAANVGDVVFKDGPELVDDLVERLGDNFLSRERFIEALYGLVQSAVALVHGLAELLPVYAWGVPVSNSCGGSYDDRV
jgi:hypothetical protein